MIDKNRDALIRMTRRQAVLALGALPLAGLSTRMLAATPAQSIDDVLRDAISRYRIPGVVAAATDRNRVLYHGAFGTADVTDGRPMREDALFRIASMTKPVTSIAAMQLIEQGRLGLDDPVERYLPEFAGLKVFEAFDSKTGSYRLKPASRPVTVRHLLTHTSGIGYGFLSPIVRDFKPHDGETYPVGPLLFDPGERFFYGPGTDSVARLVATISGQSFDAYFRERIFAPLRMSDTFYSVPSEKETRLTAIHRRETTGAIIKAPMQQGAVVQPRGDGGLASTATDYIRLVQMVLNDGTLDGARILSPESIAAMSRNQIGVLGVPAHKTAQPQRSADFSFIADGRDKWGLGFLLTADAVPGKRSAGSLSWAGINNTYFWIDGNRGIAGVILMQLLPFADPNALVIYDAFERAVYQVAGHV